MTTVAQRVGEERHRNPVLYLALVFFTILLGLASRKLDRFLPGLLHKNTGDALWATMVFFLWALVFRRKTTRFVATMAALFSIGIEFLKLYQAGWLDTIRVTLPGRLIFGYVFSWSNLLCYLLGILLAALIDLQLAPMERQPEGGR